MIPETLKLSKLTEQQSQWPAEGRVLLAHFDDERVFVYQAYNRYIAKFAVRNGCFGGGGFSMTRMTWIKPGFLWMMYRSGWASKKDQEHVLAIGLKRQAFDEILEQAVKSSYDPSRYQSLEEWKIAVAASDVRLQWDPDHGPNGEPLARRAIQLGLRGDVLVKYSREWILSIEDITPFVHEQGELAAAGDFESLVTPSESVYPVTEKGCIAIGLRGNH
jgi:hypothetical protein